MNEILFAVLGAAIFLIAAPFAGGILAGIDRILTARMQSRVGPPILQPFYDVAKLWHKEKAFANPVEGFMTAGYLIFIAAAGAVFGAGGNLLLVVFTLALAHTFLIVAAYAANAPYSHVGAERELISVMIAEPLLILLAAGFFMIFGTFAVNEMFCASGLPAVAYLPGVFLTLFAILTLKMRKSPFDISTSHHAHQELVKGVTASLSGKTLAKVEIAHWYETVLLLAMIVLFFGGSPLMLAIGVIVALLCYFLEIIIDNVYPRVTWKMTVKFLWAVTIILCVLNLCVIGVLQIGGIL
ncbi:MAG TPA: NADH-quinone oxidoreductase subunit H [Methanocorpusculum sp.]|nr:NADH-quinone oxidoreductase subunit H [Methanocorpusculum sp.]